MPLEVPELDNLTAKQRAFVIAYCDKGSSGYNVAQKSAELAGYKGNEVTLGVVGYENINKPKIKAAIAAYRAKQGEKLDHDREKAIELLHEALAMAREQGDTKAVIAAVRELDAISGLHSQTIHNTGDGLTVNIKSKKGVNAPKTGIMADNGRESQGKDYPRLASKTG